MQESNLLNSPCKGDEIPLFFNQALVRNKGLEPLTKRWQRLMITISLIQHICFGASIRIRTEISWLEAKDANRCTIEAFIILVPTVGFEPTPGQILSLMRLPLHYVGILYWLGRQGSNLQSTASKTVGIPVCLLPNRIIFGCPNWNRTNLTRVNSSAAHLVHLRQWIHYVGSNHDSDIQSVLSCH